MPGRTVLAARPLREATGLNLQRSSNPRMWRRLTSKKEESASLYKAHCASARANCVLREVVPVCGFVNRHAAVCRLMEQQGGAVVSSEEGMVRSSHPRAICSIRIGTANVFRASRESNECS
jgi:hypothetical protein